MTCIQNLPYKGVFSLRLPCAERFPGLIEALVETTVIEILQTRPYERPPKEARIDEHHLFTSSIHESIVAQTQQG